MIRKKLALTIVGCMIFMALATSCVKKETAPDLTSKDGSGSVATSQSPVPTTEARPKSEVATQKDIDEQFSAPKTGDTVALMTTSMGMIKLKLFPTIAPKTVENFVGLAKKGYYNGLKFHRVMNEFMIQGGDPNGNGSGGESIWGKPFEDEFSAKRANYRGALSMANSGPNTNGSQFFIVQNKTPDPKMIEDLKAGKTENLSKNTFSKEEVEQYAKVGGTPWLDFKHTVFGQVYQGMDVVDKIAASEVDNKSSAPKTDIKIETVEIVTIE